MQTYLLNFPRRAVGSHNRLLRGPDGIRLVSGIVSVTAVGGGPGVDRSGGGTGHDEETWGWEPTHRGSFAVRGWGWRVSRHTGSLDPSSPSATVVVGWGE